MEATELRIGNYIYRDLGSVCFDEHEVTSHTIHYFSDEESKPIPLTEEWLLKLGFYESTVFHLMGFKIGYDGDDFVNGCFSVMYKGQFLLKIKYVHTLQNLFFLIKGKELEYTP